MNTNTCAQGFVGFLRNLLPKPWVVMVGEVQISYATRESYFAQIGNKRAEIVVDAASKQEATICELSLRTWIQPRDLEIDAKDRDKIKYAIEKFLTDRGYQITPAKTQNPPHG